MILKQLVAALAMVSFVTAARAEEWRKADLATSKEVINCLIGAWLRSSSDRRYFKTRYDIVLQVVSIDEYRIPDSNEEKRFKKVKQPAGFCVKGKQRDFHALLMKDKMLTISNGRPVAEGGEVRGYTYGIMDVYQRGSELAIYVQSGGYFRRPKKGGGDCIYDATTGATRLHMRNRQHTIVPYGETDLWVADVGLPTCMTEK